MKKIKRGSILFRFELTVTILLLNASSTARTEAKRLLAIKSPCLVNSEIFVVNVGHDHVGHSLAVPLRGHVANALDGHELQTIILLSVA